MEIGKRRVIVQINTNIGWLKIANLLVINVLVSIKRSSIHHFMKKLTKTNFKSRLSFYFISFPKLKRHQQQQHKPQLLQQQLLLQLLLLQQLLLQQQQQQLLLLLLQRKVGY